MSTHVIEKVRWPDIVSRVFGRIDPIAVGGEEYKRALPNVTVFSSHTRFGPTQPDGRYTLRTEAGDEFTSDQVVIAAGSRVNVPPAILDCGVDYQTSDTVMRIPELPDHLVIVGGGFVAAEFAHVFSSLGVRVTIVVRGDGLLTHCDDSICHPFTDLASQKWDLRTHENVIGSHHDGDRIVLELDDGKTLGADMLLVATGRVPNGDQLDAELAGVRGRGRPGRCRRVPAHHRPRHLSRSATCRRRISSSTSPTTRCAWCATTCSWTGTTPPR